MPDKGHEAARRHHWKLWALIVALAVVGAGGGLIGAAIAARGPSAGVVSAGNTAETLPGSCPVASMADHVLPSVVTISATGPAGGGTGSGEVIRPDGYILTNNHVIAPAAHGGSVEVLFSDGTSAPATIVGRDALTDLAVLKVHHAHDLKAVSLGSSQSVHVGEPVIAMGAPLGLSGSVTSGIVSAMDRTVEVPAENDSSALLVSAVQTDAAINPGNSGGALVNCSGQLIGVPTAGATVPSPSGGTSAGNIGVGFAIPVDVAKTISDQIIDTGRATHAFFGLHTLPIPESAAAEARVAEGLFVAGVVSGGPAERAGLRQGDVITTIEGHPTTSNVQLQELTLTRDPGDTVTIGYVRNGHTHEARVTLGRQP
ncbi:MAG: trypsin-like peptidase domain-containing protein [Nocardiopsaceae bacterium]|nr:trypsin-like peptidase domain-containing protein [Nocardiopsaceae bacterium]